ncbi:MAG: DUF4411 family protein [Melioribacteraceae bacterium]
MCLENKIISIDKVRDEIFKNDDELKKWIEENIPDDFFKSTKTEHVIAEYKKLVQWANSRSAHYIPYAINEFLKYENADAWIVAYALAINDNSQIVTQEKSEPNRKNKIKIPEVCDAFNIQYKNIVEMFRALGETF